MSVPLADCGGGVGVADTTAGDWLGGAGDVEFLSKLLTAPLLGSLMTIPALFLAGILKLFAVDFGAGLLAGRLDIGVLLTAGFGKGVCGLPILEGGRSDEDNVDEVRTIDGGC